MKGIGKLTLGALIIAALGAVMFASTAVAQSRPAEQTAGSERAGLDVRDWLMHIHEGSRRRAYVGTFVVSVGDYMSSARIWHVCDGTQQLERVDTLTGAPRSTLRRDDDVVTFWPASRIAVSERRGGTASFPNWLQSADADIAQLYKLRRAGSARVAGYDAEIVVMQPRDSHRFGYRVWTEKKSGLILKMQTLDTSGNVLEQSAFSELTLDAPVSARILTEMMGDTAGYLVQKPSLVKTTDAAEGWRMSKVVPGFSSINCFKRTLISNAAETASPEQVFQWVFSDGLASVSLFVGVFDPARHSQSGAYAIGATHTLTKRVGAWWVTAVGEVPETTLISFVSGLERR
jgi:sigma-E factor negative regulatory protein RseB